MIKIFLNRRKILCNEQNKDVNNKRLTKFNAFTVAAIKMSRLKKQSHNNRATL